MKYLTTFVGALLVTVNCVANNVPIKLTDFNFSEEFAPEKVNEFYKIDEVQKRQELQQATLEVHLRSDVRIGMPAGAGIDCKVNIPYTPLSFSVGYAYGIGQLGGHGIRVINEIDIAPYINALGGNDKYAIKPITNTMAFHLHATVGVQSQFIFQGNGNMLWNFGPTIEVGGNFRLRNKETGALSPFGFGVFTRLTYFALKGVIQDAIPQLTNSEMSGMANELPSTQPTHPIDGQLGIGFSVSYNFGQCKKPNVKPIDWRTEDEKKEDELRLIEG